MQRVYIYTSTFNSSMVGATTFFHLCLNAPDLSLHGGGERMSWRRYVFLHRIHPHSILIGFSLLRRRKEKEQRWEEEWIMKKWSEGVNVLLRVSIFTFPAMPSHHCGRHNDYTPTHTSMFIHFSWPLVLLCGVAPCLYWALLNNAAANIPPVLDKTVSQEHNNNAKPKPSPSDCQTLPEQWTNWCNLGNGTENVCREKERERVYMCVYKYESEHACECVCVCVVCWWFMWRPGGQTL